MDITINLENEKSLEIDKIKFQKMVFLYNALNNGWSIKKKENSYIFKKNHEGKKEVLNESFSGDELIEMTTVSERFKKTFLSVLQEYIDEQALKIRKPDTPKSQANIEESTWNTYLKRQKNIIQFLTAIKKTALLVSDFDARMCELLDNYMTQSGRGQSYATKHVKLAKTVMDFAKNSKLIKVNFAETYKIKAEPKRNVKTLKQEDYEKLEKIRPLLSNTE